MKPVRNISLISNNPSGAVGEIVTPVPCHIAIAGQPVKGAGPFPTAVFPDGRFTEKCALERTSFQTTDGRSALKANIHALVCDSEG